MPSTMTECPHPVYPSILFQIRDLVQLRGSIQRGTVPRSLPAEADGIADALPGAGVAGLPVAAELRFDEIPVCGRRGSGRRDVRAVAVGRLELLVLVPRRGKARVEVLAEVAIVLA